MVPNPISAVIITLNEENVLQECLDSIQSIVDEIVVLDSGSTDRTQDIAESVGKARFVPVQWQGYGQTKNHGNDLAKHTFVLSIDADERLDEEAVAQIKKLKNNGQLNGAYSFNRKNFFGDRWIRYGGWYPDTKVRLFDKSLAKWSDADVHEMLHVDSETQVTHLLGNLLHKTVANLDEHDETVLKYSELAARKAIKRGRSLNPISSGLSAVVQFLKIFVFKLGFLHGAIGFRIALNSARSKWLRYKFFKSLS